MEYIESLGFSADSDRSVLSGKELDIFIPEKKLAIEYNGLYWHSEETGKDKWYHYRKWSECREQGIQLLTVWEDDYARNPELIKRMITDGLGVSDDSEPTVSINDAKFSSVTENEATVFLDCHHLPGFQKSARYYGLRDVSNDNVLAVMGTSCPDGGTELLISCFAVGASISTETSQECFSELLDSVLSESEHGHVLSVTAWSQNDYDDPKIFVSNGFKEVAQEEPTCSVIIAGKRQFCPDEKQLVLLEGKNRVWDCGRTQWRKFVS